MPDITTKTKVKLKTDKAILSEGEAQEYLGVGYNTLENWRKQGLRCYRVNIRKFYLLEDIIKFLRGFEV